MKNYDIYTHFAHFFLNGHKTVYIMLLVCMCKYIYIYNIVDLGMPWDTV